MQEDKIRVIVDNIVKLSIAICLKQFFCYWTKKCPGTIYYLKYNLDPRYPYLWSMRMIQKVLLKHVLSEHVLSRHPES